MIGRGLDRIGVEGDDVLDEGFRRRGRLWWHIKRGDEITVIA